MNKPQITEAQLMPLNKLVKIPHGRKRVLVDFSLLPQIDFAALKHTLLFSLSDSPKVDVLVEKEKTRLCCKVSISTDHTDWPHYEDDDEWSGDGYPDLYANAIAVAANRVFDRVEDAPIGWPEVRQKDKVTTLAYYVPTPESGGALAESLRSEWQKVRDELPSVLRYIGEGPQPGRSLGIKIPELEDKATK